MKIPLVSVVMPVYNSERYLREAIESILNQTFKDFEFLIFDDGSTDRSKEIIKEYVAKDNRIIPFYSDINCGYVVHLNKGIELAKGEFIARMDSDDISLPTRLEKQISRLKEDVSIGIMGSSTIIIDKYGKKNRTDYRETNPDLLRWYTFFYNPFSHPTVIIRKVVFAEVGFYDEDKIPSEDRDLWARVALTQFKFCNLKDPLLLYRMHGDSISDRKKEDQNAISSEVLRNHIQKTIGESVPLQVIPIFKNFHLTNVEIPFSAHRCAIRVLKKLEKKFLRTYSLSPEIKARVNQMVAERELHLHIKLQKHKFILSCYYLLTFIINRPKYTFKVLKKYVL